MTLMTKEDLILATKQRRLHVVKNFHEGPSWEEINNFYDSAKLTKTVVYNSFSTMVIEEDTRVLQHYQKAISNFSSYHKGRVLFSMMIIHFLNRNNNVMTDKNLVNLFSKFVEDNSNAELVIAGSGEIPNQLREVINSSKNIDLIGFVETPELFWDNISVLVVPVAEGGGSNIKVAEAFNIIKSVKI